MQIKIHPSWNNLGNFGITIGRFYADIFTIPRLGFFFTNGLRRWWFNPRTLKIRNDRPIVWIE